MNQRHFYTPSPFAEKYLLASDGMGIESNPKFLIDRDYFYNHLVMFVLSGTLCVEQGGKTFDIVPGFCILMTLTEPHKYYFKEKNSKIMWFHFRGFPVQALISDLSARGCLPSVTKFSSELMDAQQLLLLRKNSQMNAALEFHISSVLYRMILHLSASLFDRLQDDSLWGLKQNHPYLDYLDQHVNAPVNLDDMAANFHMSRFHFCHVFQKMFGMSPFAYLKNKKISLAKHLLLNTNESIASIANDLCFYDQGYFSKTFKEVVGITPHRFRMQNIKSGGTSFEEKDRTEKINSD